MSKNSPFLSLSPPPPFFLLSLPSPLYSKKYNFCNVSSTLPVVQESALLQRAGRGAKNRVNCLVKAEDEGDVYIFVSKHMMKKNNLLATTIFQKCFKSSNSNKDSFLTL